MIIDFLEIPPGNTKNRLDDFEQFARDLLIDMGLKITHYPYRGHDGKKDMIVYGSFANEEPIYWLVSCKHLAHSCRSVNDGDEPDIVDRLEANNCQGFIGVYSTIPSTTLSNKLHSINKNRNVRFELFDNRRIEKELLSDCQRQLLIMRYFTNSYEKHQQ